ncbi:hypothetical protein ACIBCT_31500 [Streptosporangium sp. NPDC050855]|uniref:hypothetical protein n=1 Tax=Streptosporangium sp. NPDC050855 TaxID=3366194 RepID=UPI0037A2E67F
MAAATYLTVVADLAAAIQALTGAIELAGAVRDLTNTIHDQQPRRRRFSSADLPNCTFEVADALEKGGL